MFGALFVAGVIPQPEPHIVLAPTAKEIVKPTAARASSGQMRGFAKAVLPETVVKLAIAKVVRVQDVEAAQGKIVQQFPEYGGQRFLGDFSGRQQGNVFFSQFLHRWRPVVRN